MIIALTKDGYIKKTPKNEFSIQKIGTAGVFKSYYSEGVRTIKQVSSGDTLLVITEQGMFCRIDVVDIPSTKVLEKGISLNERFNITNDNFCAIVSIKSLINSEDIGNYNILIMTQKGKIIKQKLSDYKYKRIIQAITLNENDRVADVALVKGKQYIFNSCNNGLGKIFSSDTIPTTSLISKAKGVSCFKFINNADIELCCLDCCQLVFKDIPTQSDISFLLISSQGRIRKMEIAQRYFRFRNSYGSTLTNLTENEFVIHSSFITKSDNILLITAKGNVARIDLSLIDKVKFYKKGIKLSDDDVVVACCKISRPQNIILNTKKLDISKQETEKSQALLTDIFVDIEELKPEIKSNTDSLSEMLKLLFTKEIWNKDDLDSICKSKGLILGAVLEEINDYSYSKIDNAVIEDNGDEIFVALDYKNELL